MTAHARPGAGPVAPPASADRGGAGRPASKRRRRAAPRRRPSPSGGAPIAAALLLLAAAAGIAGCKQEPKVYRESDLQEEELRREAAPLYWRLNNIPSLRAHDGGRVAVVDFTVEFVTEHTEAPPRILTPDSPKEEKPQEREARLRLMRKVQVVYEPGFPQRLTDELFAVVRTELERRTRTVVPVGDVRSSRAYQQLKVVDGFQMLVVDQASRQDPDRGYANKVMVFPVSGLGIALGTRDRSVEEVAIDLIRELDVDIAARARLRVSVHRGRAALESGSRIWVLSRHMWGDMTLSRRLVSEEEVLQPDEFRVARPQLFPVDDAKYTAAMRRLLQTAVSMGFDAAS